LLHLVVSACSLSKASESDAISKIYCKEAIPWAAAAVFGDVQAGATAVSGDMPPGTPAGTTAATWCRTVATFTACSFCSFATQLGESSPSTSSSMA